MSDRQSLPPVTGLKRTSSLPPPPARQRPATRPAAAPTAAATAAAAPTTAPATAAGDTAKRSSSVTSSRPKREAPRPASRSHDADLIRAVSLSIPIHLAHEFKEYARSHKVTHADLLMDAIVAHQDHLGGLIDESRPQPQRDGLFVRTPAKVAGETTYVSLSLRMSSQNLVALDRLCEDHGADSRSQLCVAALSAYLEGD